MSFNEKLSAAEAVLFSYGEPIEAERLAEITETDLKTVEGFVNMLNDRYESCGSSFCIVKLDKSYQMCTRKEYAAYVKKALDTSSNMPVSQAAMETLALIAYNQPVTKSFIESVRGTDSSSVVNKLAEKGLICEAGRLEIPGRPIAYKTSEIFLKCFGLSSVDELPPLEAKPFADSEEREE